MAGSEHHYELKVTWSGLHDVAHRSCFIARSVSFPVRHEPEIYAAA